MYFNKICENADPLQTPVEGLRLKSLVVDCYKIIVMES